MSRGVIGGGTVRVPRDAKEIQDSRVRGYKTGGAVSPEGAVHKHESHLHKGKAETKFKGGGAVKGKAAKKRLDKKPRRSAGGASGDADAGDTAFNDSPRTDVRKLKQPQFNVDAEGPQKRARGGHVKKGHGKNITNVIVHAGGPPQPPAGGANPMAALGALAKLKGAGGPGPGMPPGPPPGAAPPPGPMGGGAPAPQPGLAPPFRKRGGKVDSDSGRVVKVKAHKRRRSGGAV